jgi:hypothetical protein
VTADVEAIGVVPKYSSHEFIYAFWSKVKLTQFRMSSPAWGVQQAAKIG